MTPTFAGHSLLWRFPLVAIFAIFGANVFLDAGIRGHLSATLARGLARIGLDAAFAARHAELAVYAGAALELSGAAALAQHGGERCGAAMLGAFMLLVTPIVHWPFQDDATGAASATLSQHHLIETLKNLSIMGGLWLAWNVGCDNAAEKKAAKKAAAKVA